MSFYNEYILPHVINLSMRNHELRPYRERVLSRAEGRGLEIGIGSGLNLPFYGTRVAEVLGLEPAARLLAMAQRTSRGCAQPVTLIAGSAEAIPIEDQSVDTVVTTWTCADSGCSPCAEAMRRVLRAVVNYSSSSTDWRRKRTFGDGKSRLTPLWTKIGGGCHLNCPIRNLIASAGFDIGRLQTGYMKGPKPMTFMYEGRATPC